MYFVFLVVGFIMGVALIRGTMNWASRSDEGVRIIRDRQIARWQQVVGIYQYRDALVHAIDFFLRRVERYNPDLAGKRLSDAIDWARSEYKRAYAQYESEKGRLAICSDEHLEWERIKDLMIEMLADGEGDGDWMEGLATRRTATALEHTEHVAYCIVQAQLELQAISDLITHGTPDWHGAAARFRPLHEVLFMRTLKHEICSHVEGEVKSAIMSAVENFDETSEIIMTESDVEATYPIKGEK